MHRLDFRYRDDNNNKATYSAVDTSSDGNKTHSIEINLTTKAFKVYHKTLQETLVSSVNIKTVNGSSVLGSGNVEVKTYQAFPNGDISGTLQQVVQAIMAFPTKARGMTYLGGISGSCTPFGYGNVECTVTFMTNNIAVLSVSSSNIYPYHWEYNTYANDYKWRSFITMPDKPSDFSSSTYTLKFVNGNPTWVKE